MDKEPNRKNIMMIVAAVCVVLLVIGIGWYSWKTMNDDSDDVTPTPSQTTKREDTLNCPPCPPCDSTDTSQACLTKQSVTFTESRANPNANIRNLLPTDSDYTTIKLHFTSNPDIVLLDDGHISGGLFGEEHLVLSLDDKELTNVLTLSRDIPFQIVADTALDDVSIVSIAMSGTGTILAVGTIGDVLFFKRQEDKTFVLDSNRTVSKPSDATDAFGSDVALNADGSELFVSEMGGTVYHFKAETSGSTATYTVQNTIDPPVDVAVNYGSRIELSGDGKILAVSNSPDDIYIFTRSNNTYSLTHTINNTTYDIGHAMGMDSKGSVLAVKDTSEDIYIYTLVNGEYVLDDTKTIPRPDSGAFGNDILVSGDGKRILVGNYENDMIFMFELDEDGVYQVDPQKTIAVEETDDMQYGFGKHMAASLDMSMIAVSDDTNKDIFIF